MIDVNEHRKRNGNFFNKDSWKSIIDQWRSGLQSYSDDYEKEKYQGYYYNERATLGFLFAAMAQVGVRGLLQEFWTERIYVEKNNEWRYHGRCDLFGIIDEEDIYFEAKQIWGNDNNDPPSIMSEIGKAIKEASSQLDSIKEAKNKIKVSIVFLVPSPLKKNYCPAEENLLELFRQLGNSLSLPNLIIDLFEPAPDRVPEWKNHGKTYLYPGCFLLIVKHG